MADEQQQQDDQSQADWLTELNQEKTSEAGGSEAAAPEGEASSQPSEEAKPPEPPAPAPREQGGQYSAEDIQRMREKLIEDMTGRYSVQFTEQEREALKQNPHEVLASKLPRLAAQMYVDAFEAVHQTLWSQLPDYVRSQTSAVVSSQEYERRFYERWPQLKDPKLSEAILRIGRVYREVKPDAKPEEAIEEIGAQAVAMLGLNSQRSSTPQQTFTPAAPAAAASPSAKSSNPQETFWEKLSREWENI